MSKWFRKRREVLAALPAAEPKPSDELVSLRALAEGMERAIRVALGDSRYEGWEIARLAAALSGQIETLELKMADERANWLLDQHLNHDQRVTWKKGKGYVDVKGKTTTYRIDRTARVIALDRGHLDKSMYRRTGQDLFLCTYPSAQMPIADTILAIKLQIEGAEAEFLKVANPNSHGGQHLTVDGQMESAYPPGLPVRNPIFDVYQDINTLRRQIAATQVDQVQAGTRTAPLEVTTFGDNTRTFLTGARYQVGNGPWTNFGITNNTIATTTTTATATTEQV